MNQTKDQTKSLHNSVRSPATCLHRLVANRLRQRIIRGDIAPGNKLPSFRELSAEFKVSLVTINRALKLLEQEKRVRRIAGLGIFAHTSSAIHPPKQPLLTLAVPWLFSRFDAQIAHGAEQAARKFGWGIQILTADIDPDRERKNLEQLFDCGAKGAIVMPAFTTANYRALFDVCSQGMPIVLVDKAIPGIPADCVESDHQGGAFLATQYFIDKGHRNLRMISLPSDIPSVAARMLGFERAAAAAGISLGKDSITQVNRPIQNEKLSEDALATIMKTLADGPKPVAVFAVNWNLAWGTCLACQKLGLRIPEEVSLISFDEPAVIDGIHPSMTIVQQHATELGYAAVELLLRRMEIGVPSRESTADFVHRIIGVNLIERNSVANLMKFQSDCPTTRRT